jgi:hypothetical protein
LLCIALGITTTEDSVQEIRMPTRRGRTGRANVVDADERPTIVIAVRFGDEDVGDVGRATGCPQAGPDGRQAVAGEVDELVKPVPTAGLTQDHP